MRPLSNLERSLLDKTYTDPADSGELLMKVIGVDELNPNTVIVQPVGHGNRAWARSAEAVAEAMRQTYDGVWERSTPWHERVRVIDGVVTLHCLIGPYHEANGVAWTADLLDKPVASVLKDGFVRIGA